MPLSCENPFATSTKSRSNTANACRSIRISPSSARRYRSTGRADSIAVGPFEVATRVRGPTDTITLCRATHLNGRRSFHRCDADLDASARIEIGLGDRTVERHLRRIRLEHREHRLTDPGDGLG